MAGLEAFVDQLKRLRELRKAEGDTGRVHGYNKVIASMKAWVSPGLPTVTELGQLPGIGKSTTERYHQFLTTGVIDELATTFDPERTAVMKHFSLIHGVSDVTAGKWYDMGLVSMAMLVEYVNTHPHFLTDAQYLSLLHLDDLNARIPRAELVAFDAQLRRAWPVGTVVNGVQVKWEIAGSYRRGKPESGDVDVIVLGVTAQAFLEHLMNVEQRQVITGILSSGEKKLMGVAQLVPGGRHRRLDVEMTQPWEYYPALLYFTGSKESNVRLRELAGQLGLHLNEKALTIAATGAYIPVESEEAIYSLLGLPYMPPPQRG